MDMKAVLTETELKMIVGILRQVKEGTLDTLDFCKKVSDLFFKGNCRDEQRISIVKSLIEVIPAS